MAGEGACADATEGAAANANKDVNATTLRATKDMLEVEHGFATSDKVATFSMPLLRIVHAPGAMTPEVKALPSREGPGSESFTMDALVASEITALLGRGTRFEGKLFFEGRVRIDGSFKGEIKSDDTLIIGEGAEIHAEIDVATVIVRGGVVHGNIRARQALEIHSPAKVVGDVHSPSLYIERGVEFQGSCRMDAVEPNEAPAPPPLPKQA